MPDLQLQFNGQTAEVELLTAAAKAWVNQYVKGEAVAIRGNVLRFARCLSHTFIAAAEGYGLEFVKNAAYTRAKL